MSQVNANSIYDASGGQSAKLYGVSMRNGGTAYVNRIINGDMRIDQRNAGASVSTAGGGYPVDRWQVQYGTGTLTLQQSGQAPAGFTNSLGITVTSAGTRLATDYFLLNQKIEGFNFSDLGFGSTGASTVTLSFWVRSSVTGTFSGVLASGDNTRTYPFTYTINAANTWEQKSVTIVGDTSGGTTAYPTTNGIGAFVKFDLGSGSNYEVASAGSWQASTNKIGVTSQVGWAQTSGATFYITGVQLEAGSVASPFERRDYGRELMMAQRYFEKTFPVNTAPVNAAGQSSAEVFLSGPQNGGGFGGNMYFSYTWKVTKRAAPTMTAFDTRDTVAGTWSTYDGGVRANTTPVFEVATENAMSGYIQRGTLSIAAMTASAEL